MATEGAVHTDKDHVWHMNTIGSFVDPDDGLLMATPYHSRRPDRSRERGRGNGWWTELTETRRRGHGRQAVVVRRDGSRGCCSPR